MLILFLGSLSLSLSLSFSLSLLYTARYLWVQFLWSFKKRFLFSKAFAAWLSYTCHVTCWHFKMTLSFLYSWLDFVIPLLALSFACQRFGGVLVTTSRCIGLWDWTGDLKWRNLLAFPRVDSHLSALGWDYPGLNRGYYSLGNNGYRVMECRHQPTILCATRSLPTSLWALGRQIKQVIARLGWQIREITERTSKQH